MARRTVNARGVILKKTALRRARKDAGFSQNGLAEEIGKHIMSLWRAENERPIDIETARLISQAIKVPLPELIRKSA